MAGAVVRGDPADRARAGSGFAVVGASRDGWVSGCVRVGFPPGIVASERFVTGRSHRTGCASASATRSSTRICASMRRRSSWVGTSRNMCRRGCPDSLISQKISLRYCGSTASRTHPNGRPFTPGAAAITVSRSLTGRLTQRVGTRRALRPAQSGPQALPSQKESRSTTKVSWGQRGQHCEQAALLTPPRSYGERVANTLKVNETRIGHLIDGEKHTPWLACTLTSRFHGGT